MLYVVSEHEFKGMRVQIILPFEIRLIEFFHIMLNEGHWDD